MVFVINRIRNNRLLKTHKIIILLNSKYNIIIKMNMLTMNKYQYNLHSLNIKIKLTKLILHIHLE